MKGLERCVEVWPAAAAEEMERRMLSSLNPMSRDARRIQRRFFSHSEAVELDSAGRVRLSAQLIEHAGLSGKCVITGMGDRLEIWSPDEWEREDVENDERAPQLAEELAEAQRSAPLLLDDTRGQR